MLSAEDRARLALATYRVVVREAARRPVRGAWRKLLRAAANLRAALDEVELRDDRLARGFTQR